MLTTHTVTDGDRSLQFSGVLLASASSAEDGKVRWAELAVYRTVGGSYVIHGVGRTSVDGETDRPWASTIDDAVGLVSRLTLVDSDGVHYLPNVNRDLLIRAAISDRAIAEAYAVQRVA